MEVQTPRPFRFGAAFAGAHSLAEWQDTARTVAQLGYDTLLLPDHVFLEFEPLTGLLAAAQAVPELTVGTYVINNDFHHPALLAREAVTLATLTEGRFELGIGGGWNKWEYDQLGISFDAPRVHVDRLEESLSVIKQLFKGERVNFDGEYYHIHNFSIPTFLKKPPIFIGGAGKRMLSMAAREADIVGINMKLGANNKTFAEMSEEKLAQRVNWIREAAGERFADLELNLLLQKVIITDHPIDVVKHFLETDDWGNETVRRDQHATVTWSDITPEQFLSMPYYFIGTVDELAAKARRLRDTYNISYICVFEEALERFAPVAAKLRNEE